MKSNFTVYYLQCTRPPFGRQVQSRWIHQSSTHPCPIYCTSRAAPKGHGISFFHSYSLHISRQIPRYGASTISHYPPPEPNRYREEMHYLWQVDVWYNNAVKSAWSVFRRILRVSAGVILILEVLTRFIALGAPGLPWHTASSNVDFGFGGSGCWLTACMKGSIGLKLSGADGLLPK
jgi:hypothetical protein